MSEWASLSALTLARAIRDKTISASEVLEYFIERYERLNPEINAIVATNLDQARKAAADADEALARGKILGPLHGLPMTLKDNLPITGMPTTYGSALLAEYMPEENADVVQSVLDAGAVVFGKTNLPLLGMDTQTFNEIYGQTNNPWDTTRTPGGSSGGAAAALAAGLSPLEIGNDIGGSIRLPAHFCGIYGHKPSYNIVSTQGLKTPLSPVTTGFPVDLDLLVNGPLARSAEDLMLAMEVIVGAPPYQRKAIKIDLPHPRRSALSDFMVGVWMNDPLFPLDDEVAAVLGHFVDRLGKAGVRLVDRQPDIDLKRSHRLRNTFETATLCHELPGEIWDRVVKLRNLDEGKVGAWARDMTMQHRDWNLLNAERSVIRQKWEDYFDGVDVMLCPVARIPAHPHDHTPIPNRTVRLNDDTLDYWEVIGPWNSLSLLAYLPATVAPAGFTPSGLPVGIQIVGPYLEDLTPIQFAIELEREIIGPYQLPPAFDGHPR
jgi:amidase